MTAEGTSTVLPSKASSMVPEWTVLLMNVELASTANDPPCTSNMVKPLKSANEQSAAAAPYIYERLDGQTIRIQREEE